MLFTRRLKTFAHPSWPVLPGLCAALFVAACSEPAAPPSLPDPERVVERVMLLTPDPERGHGVFKGWCIPCHGDQAQGEPPTDFDLGDENPRRFRGYDKLTHREHVEVIVNGFVSKQSGNQNMPSFLLRLTPRQIADVSAYEQQVMSLPEDYHEPLRRRWMEDDFE